MTARTDLWELWGSNRPEPPGLTGLGTAQAPCNFGTELYHTCKVSDRLNTIWQQQSEHSLSLFFRLSSFLPDIRQWHRTLLLNHAGVIGRCFTVLMLQTARPTPACLPLGPKADRRYSGKSATSGKVSLVIRPLQSKTVESSPPVAATEGTSFFASISTATNVGKPIMDPPG